MIYHGFPRRLHHAVPPWVEPGALFHIRVALDRDAEQRALTDPTLAEALLDSARLYESKHRWHITLLILMPDHLHALLSFARDESMGTVIGDWKRFHANTNGIAWQDGFFDHRLRADERGQQLAARMDYIRQNPVAAGLCAKAENWPWIIDPFAQVDRLLRRPGQFNRQRRSIKFGGIAASPTNAPGGRVPPTTHFIVTGGSTSPKAMPIESPKAQY